MSRQQQGQLLLEARETCFRRIFSEPTDNLTGLWCNMTWDSIMCWDYTPAGTVVYQKCPEYIHGLSKTANAFKECTSDGTWFKNPLTNKTWTNYTSCAEKSIVAATTRMNEIELITNLGYGVSLASLSVAIVIMASCKRLHYKSNILHINLFMAFILRALFALLRQNLFVQGLALDSDLITMPEGNLKFKDGVHWQCRLLFSLFHYGISVSQMWIFVEGLYLQMLIYRTLFTQQRSVRMYTVFGWLFPLTFLIPWVVVRIKFENTLCWNVNQELKYLWIIRGPLVITISINFLFFLDNLRVLFHRTRATNKSRGNSRTYRKLAKFTVMLVPLFGVPNVVFMTVPPTVGNEDVDIPYMYISMVFSSFQGFILALLFCFLHEEVHSNIRRSFQRYVIRRRDTLTLTKSGPFSWGRRRGSFQSQQCPSSEVESLRVNTAIREPNFSAAPETRWVTRCNSMEMSGLTQDVRNGSSVYGHRSNLNPKETKPLFSL